MTGFTQRNSVVDFLQAKCDLTPKSAVMRFWAPPPWGEVGLGATYDNHLKLIGMRVVDFLLVLIKLFFASCYGWGATSEYLFKIGDFAPTGVGWPKISGRRGCPTNHSSCHKTRVNGLLCGIRMRTPLSFVLSQSRVNWQTDGQTDRQTEFSLLDRVCISCSAVKTVRLSRKYRNTFSVRSCYQCSSCLC